MNIRGPLRAALFFYEVIRFSLLAVFLYITPEGDLFGTFFPYIVYLSANALFPLMALFVWLRPEEYRNYLTLYMAGKIIGMVSFLVWEIFGSRKFTGLENPLHSLVFLGGTVFLNLADTLTVLGAWTLNKNNRTENGGIKCG